MIFVTARGINIFVQLASTILLARLLSPHDFGLVAMVLALVGFAPMLIDLGTTEASVQKTHITQGEISTVFWLNLAIGIALTVLLAASSGVIARLFGEPSLTDIALVLSADIHHGRRIDTALRADAPRHAISTHRDHRYFGERGRQHRQHRDGVRGLGILVACGKADRDVRPVGHRRHG